MILLKCYLKHKSSQHDELNEVKIFEWNVCTLDRLSKVSRKQQVSIHSNTAYCSMIIGRWTSCQFELSHFVASKKDGDSFFQLPSWWKSKRRLIWCETAKTPGKCANFYAIIMIIKVMVGDEDLKMSPLGGRLSDELMFKRSKLRSWSLE